MDNSLDQRSAGGEIWFTTQSFCGSAIVLNRNFLVAQYRQDISKTVLCQLSKLNELQRACKKDRITCNFEFFVLF